MRPGDIVSINSRKFDGSIRRSWECELLSIDGSQLVFGGEFLEDIDHAELGLIRRGTISREYYWTDRWYNVFQFQEADANLRNYYCNINMPPVLSERVLDYVDLDIDVVVWPGGSYTLLDEVEFEENAVKFGYPPLVKRKARAAVDELIALIDSNSLP